MKKQNLKVVEADDTKTTEEKRVEKKKAREVVEKARGKKYLESKAKINKSISYKALDAIKLIKDTSYSSFDGTMEVHLTVKKKGLTANVKLPFSAGREKKVEVASEETVKKLQSGKVDFDILLSTAEMMPKLVPFAKILGPKGLMPNPKNGTIIKSEKDADKFSANSITIKTEKDAPLIHMSFGKVSQKDSELEANLEAIISSVNRLQIVKAYIKATMSPSVKLSV